MEHVAVKDIEVVSLEGRDMVTIIINGIAYDMPSLAAKLVASDLKAAVKRIGAK